MTIPPVAPPAVLPAPAPWLLHGSGYVLLLKFDKKWLLQHGFIPAELAPHLVSTIGTVMFVDYASSPVGPYHELLFVPGRFTIHGQPRFSVTKIYVSTWESIVNGRENWRIPKELAQFEVTKTGREERLQVWSNGECWADLTFAVRSLKLPITTSFIPAAWRTLAQPDPEKIFYTTLSGRGQASPATVLHSHLNPTFFPDFAQARLLSAVKVTQFQMTFPTPELKSW